MHRLFEFVRLHSNHVTDQGKCPDRDSLSQGAGRRHRPRNGLAHSLLATTQPLPASVIIQPRRILPSTYLSISFELRITAHKHLQNRLSEHFAKQRITSKPSFATQQQPTWRSSSPAAPTPSPASSKVTRTSQRSVRTAATSARESTSAGSGSRSASFRVRRNALSHHAQNRNETNKQTEHRKTNSFFFLF